ncbi:sigma-70 family RNA polymerase sigma factor [Arsenicitalea aurantiaca]|uniref:RNA polymerase sigma factor n=1 Tax=Arsenicitalea aurantiaca TaxID=1783274 RepID=A0A433XEF2_9HYPH|nr:sigma-70 family RNA polymerase sigma factor [Arsenicitalea aurantiaca]RUT32507.1 sigma-70 family RNA polymerase sigma factor [Arsenicitalea aurantiaca]
MLDRTADEANAWMARVAKGDRQALEMLFRSEAPRMMAVSRRIVRRTDLAEEVVQESFVTAWQRAAQFDPERGNARAWLTTIVRNRSLNMLRDGARVDHHDGETLEALGDRVGDAHDAYDRLPDRDALKACLSRLDETKRRSILLCYVVGMSHGEVAAKLDAPLGTVKAWIRRGMSALQECMA